MCAVSLAIGGMIAALALGRHGRHPLADIVPPHFPHPAARH
jgi:hypothetical protein